MLHAGGGQAGWVSNNGWGSMGGLGHCQVLGYLCCAVPGYLCCAVHPCLTHPLPPPHPLAAEPGAAMQARNAMHGRKFGGRVVEAVMMTDADYSSFKWD